MTARYSKDFGLLHVGIAVLSMRHFLWRGGEGATATMRHEGSSRIRNAYKLLLKPTGATSQNANFSVQPFELLIASGLEV